MKGIDKNGEEIDEQNGDEEAAESDEEEEQQWISETSLLTNFQHDWGLLLGEDLLNKIVKETNCYACQKLADNEQCLG